MVRLTLSLLAKRTFIDRARITVQGGRGGNGLPKYGGVGGKGGDVYLQASKIYSLKKLKLEYPTQKWIAEPGEDSRRFSVLGKAGNDLTVLCPPGVSAVTDQKITLGDVNQEGDRLLLCKGGNGGGPENGFIGEKGQSFAVNLDLKLLADVGFVGFPNAGKSTLLRALSNAQPKVASYPFTTIQPQIGTLCYNDSRLITAADLPGLIEGSHLNRGMGHKFLKHCIRTKVLLFVVDIDGFRLNPSSDHRNAISTILYLNRELELYDEELVTKPAILAINKIDTDVDGTKLEALKQSLRCIKSIAKNVPSDMSPETLIKFDAILPISALNGTNIPELKDKIRTIIDIYVEERERKQKRVTVSTNPEYDVIYV